VFSCVGHTPSVSIDRVLSAEALRTSAGCRHGGSGACAVRYGAPSPAPRLLRRVGRLRPPERPLRPPSRAGQRIDRDTRFGVRTSTLDHL
jgi:hypothetical protein